LRAGLTTVFDTWGPRTALMRVRDEIASGEEIGSRIFCGGNIIGFDGPFSPDFIPKAVDVVSSVLLDRVNATFVENVGRHLMWLEPRHVVEEVEKYISLGIDFVKYASNEHGLHSGGAFLAFAPRVQAAIVEAAHRAGLIAQSHATSIEGLRLAVEAGCDLIQHANTTGPVPIPGEILELMEQSGVSAVVFPITEARLEYWNCELGPRERAMNANKNVNAKALIDSGVPLLMAWDASVWPPEVFSDPNWGKVLGGDDNPASLGSGHIFWFKAMDELGCKPIEALRAATINIARAYGKADELGSIEIGKLADLLVLDADPLADPENYARIAHLIKDGEIVDRETLPERPVLTRPDERVEEQDRYIAAFRERILSGCPCPLF
jgi:imidazolonepropionase-like amidohydrolase